MEKEQFYQEIDSYIHQLKSGFLTFQEIIWNGLILLSEICERNQISYQLAYGSLLGAIRDKGQIPWDYDIDIFVKYEDRKKLVEVLKKELPSDYFVDSLETNQNCDSYKIRVVPKQYDAMNAHIDIFLLVPAPDNESIYKKLGKKFVLLSKIRRYKTGSEFKYGKNSRVTHLDNTLHKFLYCLFPLRVVDSLYQKTVNKTLGFKSNYYMLADRWALFDRIPREFFDQTTKICVQGHYFAVPCDYFEMLKRSYKDYSKIYPINQRFDEWYDSCKRINLISGKEGYYKKDSNSP